MKKIWFASSALSALIMIQPGLIAAETLPPVLRLAQTDPRERDRREQPRPPAERAPPPAARPAPPAVQPPPQRAQPRVEQERPPMAQPQRPAAPIVPAVREPQPPARQEAPARQVAPAAPPPPAPHAVQPAQGAPRPPVPGQAPGQQGQRPPPAAPLQQPPAQQQAVPGQGGGQPPGSPGAPPRQAGRPGIGLGGAAAIGAAAGLVGGFLAGNAAQRLDQVRQSRQEFNDNGMTIIQEPGRTIVRDNEGYFIRHDENERFRDLGYAVRSERRGDEFVSSYVRPDGEEIITITDADGRLLRRLRRLRDGREIVIIDNTFLGPPGSFAQDVVLLPPPPLVIPEDRYFLNADAADEGLIYETLMAPPIAALPQRYTLDQIRYSYDLRARMRSVNLDSITFDTGAWDVTPDQFGRLAAIAKAVGQAVQRNPNEVFLVEGYTDAVGSDVDNLSLSDRRAQSIAAILTKSFGVPPENLVTQGYGKQFPRVRTLEANRENRRVTIQRITPLLDGASAR